MIRNMLKKISGGAPRKETWADVGHGNAAARRAAVKAFPALAGIEPIYTTWSELSHLVDSGMPVLEAVAAATALPIEVAERMGGTPLIGQLFRSYHCGADMGDPVREEQREAAFRYGCSLMRRLPLGVRGPGDYLEDDLLWLMSRVGNGVAREVDDFHLWTRLNAVLRELPVEKWPAKGDAAGWARMARIVDCVSWLKVPEQALALYRGELGAPPGENEACGWGFAQDMAALLLGETGIRGCGSLGFQAMHAIPCAVSMIGSVERVAAAAAEVERQQGQIAALRAAVIPRGERNPFVEAPLELEMAANAAEFHQFYRPWLSDEFRVLPYPELQQIMRAKLVARGREMFWHAQPYWFAGVTPPSEVAKRVISASVANLENSVVAAVDMAVGDDNAFLGDRRRSCASEMAAEATGDLRFMAEMAIVVARREAGFDDLGPKGLFRELRLSATGR